MEGRYYDDLVPPKKLDITSPIVMAEIPWGACEDYYLPTTQTMARPIRR
jgi:hypothetical protein